MKLSTEEEFKNLTEKGEWDHLSSVTKWKGKCLRLFNEACSLIVHAHQIDMKIKKSDFIKPKKNIYSDQEDLFNTPSNDIFDIKDFIKKVHQNIEKKEIDEKEDIKVEKEGEISVWVEFDHFSRAIELCLEEFFEKGEVKDFNIKPIGFSNLTKLEKLTIDTNLYRVQHKKVA